jgi:hypothetical protein
MAKCQDCKGDLKEGAACPSVVTRGRGLCYLCARVSCKESRNKNPKSFLLYSSRSNSKVRGIENTLVLADIPDIPEFCPVFSWIRLEHRVGAERRDSSPSLDRIDNTRGYVKGNVRIISWRANRLKGNATDEELAALGLDATKRKTCNKRRRQATVLQSLNNQTALI